MKSLNVNKTSWFVTGTILLSTSILSSHCLAGISIGEIYGPLSLDSAWPPQGEGGPCWSPDGTMIVFSWGDGYTAWDPSLGWPNPDGSYIVIMTAEGEAIRGPDNPLVNDIGWDNGMPDWSPDGSWIVYIKSRVGPAQILKVPSTGGDAVPITEIDGNWHPRCPKWSPDGTKIAYRGGDYWTTPNGRPYHIWITDTDGSTHEDLTPGIIGYGVTGLSWSPDGTRIVFTQEASGLIVLDVQTREITTLPAFPSGLAASAPVWCSDGDSVLFTSNEGICCYQIDTQEITQLTDGPDQLGDWHPIAGIVFSSTRDCTVRWDSDIYTAINICNDYAKPGPQTGNSRDIVLIYIGQYGTYLRDWTSNDFTPYISYVDVHGVPRPDKWMFDGFLFLALESIHSTNGKNRIFMWANPNDSSNPSYPSLKEDWDWLLDNRFFIPGKQLGALHARASDLSRQLNVFVMIPYPDRDAGIAFGDVDNDGDNEDFTDNNDRYKAVKWYIERFLSAWNIANYDDFLNLVGFYWMHEAVYSGDDDDLLLARVAEYIHSRGCKFMWVPYQGDKEDQEMRRNWIEPWYSYGFDFAIIQPNYYQTKWGRVKDDLRNTADFAKENCLGVEIEFDEGVIDDPDSQNRFKDYLDAGKDMGYREGSVLAYYQGFKTVQSLALYNLNIRHLYDNLFRFINRSRELRPGEDADADGIVNEIETATGTDPFNDDTDNDGLIDGSGSGEDGNGNGVVDPGETDPVNPDTDGDGIQDGTESGLVAPEGLDTDLTMFVPDADPSITTDPTNPDTDGDGLLDGEEDTNGNGAVDPGESDPSAVTGVMDLDPNVFNLKSKGKWVTCYIELPQGYDATDITLQSVALNSTIPPDFSVYEFGDYNANGIIDLMVKFDRELLIEVLGSVEHGQDIVLTLTGQLSNGTRFEGLDTIKVIEPSHK